MPQDHELDSSVTYNRLRNEIAGLDGPADLSFGKGQTTFGHLMGGYDAGYYGYLVSPMLFISLKSVSHRVNSDNSQHEPQWSQVFALDMYYTGFKQNPMNPENGRRYRHEVLEKGGSRDEMESLKAFLKREPNSKAFFKELGIDA